MIDYRKPPDGMQPWEQLTLFQPEAVTVEMILHICDGNVMINGGVRATELMTGATLHTEAAHWEATQVGVGFACSRYLAAASYWGEVVWQGLRVEPQIET